MDKLYKKIRAEMLLHGDTQTTLAEKLGVTVNTLNNKLSGKTEWYINEIDFMCREYDKTYEELFAK